MQVLLSELSRWSFSPSCKVRGEVLKIWNTNKESADGEFGLLQVAISDLVAVSSQSQIAA